MAAGPPDWGVVAMFEDREPQAHALEGVVLPTLGDAATGSTPPSRRLRWRTRTRIAAVVLATVALAVAVVVPVELSGISTVAGAASGVFSRPTVRFVLTESGTPALRGYAVALTIASPTGRAVSKDAARDTAEISVLHGATDLADFLVTNRAIYLRIDARGIDQLAASDGASVNLVHLLDKAAGRRPELSYLRQLAAGGWVGMRLAPLERYLKQAERHLGLSSSGVHSKVSRVDSAFKLSLAEAWDAWATLHVVRRGNTSTEYAVKLPVRNFVRSFASSFEGQLARIVPRSKSAFPTLNRAIERIPAGFKLPIDLWIAGGSLVKVAVSYHGQTLTVAITHPSVVVTNPPGATYITVRQIEALILYEEGSATIAGLGSSSATGAASNLFGTSGLGVSSSSVSQIASSGATG